MASIKQRKGKDGELKYQVQIRVKGFPSQTATFSRKTDAKRWAQQTETKIKEGKYFKTREEQKRTLSELIDKYVSSVLPQKKSQRGPRGQLKWWRSQLGYMILCDVNAPIIAVKRDELLVGITPRGKRRSNASVVRYLAILSHVFSYGIKELQWLENNPVSKIRKPSEPRGRVRFLSTEERQNLLEACKQSKNKHLYLITVLALSTGMRASEILNLKWSDIDLPKGMIVLHKTKNNERRAVPLTGLALELIKKEFQKKTLNYGLLFPSRRFDKPISFRTAWETVVRRAGLKDFNFHSCRHDFASSLLASGASIAQLAEVLGHKTLQMVKRYSHLCEGTAKDIVGKMTMEIFR